ncbi:MAG: DUF5667 domain-containing protein [Dehalococcoidia bacterium]
MAQRIEEILDQCLEALRRGESVESCLASFPEHSQELEPLLRIAHLTIISSSIGPPQELKGETKRNLHLSSPESQHARQFEEVLSHCIDMLLDGHSVERCLELYPAHVPALEPLLRIAAGTKQALAVEARVDFKDSARDRILAYAGRRKWPRFLSRVLSPRWTYRGAVAAVLVLVLSIAGVGTIRASSDSMPDDLLYPVKEFTEKVELTLATSKAKEAEVHVKLADRRAHELAAMASDGDYERVARLAQELSEHLEKVSLLVQQQQAEAAIKTVFDGDPSESPSRLEFDDVRDLRQALDEDIQGNAEMFEEALALVPLNMRADMKAMLADAKEQYQKAIQALEFIQPTGDLLVFKGGGLAYNR